MTKKITTLISLTLIVALGIVTRFYLLGKAPAGLYLDEAAQGYNAYSILKTGKDEFGKSFPIVFRSFADFKTPIYIYLIVPLIPIFDLTAFTVRFPSFFFSVLTIPLLYLLIKELSPKKLLEIRNSSLDIGVIATAMIAISPWHILFGRTNFECNVALFFLLVAIYLFYRALKRPPLLILSALFFALTIPAYHSQRVIVPLVLLLLFIRHRRILFSTSHRRSALIGLVAGLLLSWPTLSIMTTPGFLARAATLNIFTQVPSGSLAWYQGPVSWLVNAPWYLSVKEFFSLYLSYFSPRNLFLLGDYGPRSSFPDLATLFTWQFPFYLYGLYRLVIEKKLGELRFLMLSLLLISPLPAAVTRDPFTTIRALPMVIPLSFIISLGLIRFYQLLLPIFRKFALSIFAVILVYSLANLYSSAIVLNEHFRARYWDYGWRQVVNRLNALDPDLPVVVDSARSEAYSQILFFTKFDPARYQRENFEVPLSEYYHNLDRNLEKNIGRITVRGIHWKPDLAIEQYLVGDYLAISLEQIKNNHLTLIEEIDYPDGSVAYRIVKTNPPL
jgi:4-amino-4-deoxy-L-arabinose transferase-like glycosyltransferase